MPSESTRSPTDLLLVGTYTAADVADLLKCSVRHVRRLDDGHLILGRIVTGRLVRFARRVVDEWILDGCPRQVRR